MRLADRVSGLRIADVNHLLAQTGSSDGSLGKLAIEMERAAFQLRRETVAAVARQQRLRDETFAARQLADAVEHRAIHALETGNEILARQILAREMCTLKSREALEEELAEATRCVTQLLRRLMRTEDQARLVWRRKEELGKGGCAC